jgi:hypothetical protein
MKEIQFQQYGKPKGLEISPEFQCYKTVVQQTEIKWYTVGERQ